VIYFIAPDLARPSGGVRTIYRSVDLLNAAGIGAAVIHGRKGFRCRWFENATSVVYPPLRLGMRDVLVPPESLYLRRPGLAPGVRKVIFHQNAYRSFRHSPAPAGTLRSSLTDTPDVVGVLVVSEDNERYLEHAFPGISIARVHHWIDPQVFHLDASARRRKIAVMPRKRRDEFEQLFGILTARQALVGWELEALEGRTEADVAARLRESVLFISLSKAEGFGLPPAEAMACGCHVIGFHGMGGREIFQPPFALAIEDGDVLALAMAVEEFLVTYDERAAELEQQALHGAAFIASTYSRECATEDLTRFFNPLEQSAGRDVEVSISRRDISRTPRLKAAAQRRLRRVGRRVVGARP
jgi:glycosyltransferase involved in cell wall biosynthesis